MLMTIEDREEMKDLMKGILSTHTAVINGQFKLIASDLTHIKEQTTKTNGRVTKLEEQRQAALLLEASHFQNCPIAEKVEVLELDRTTRKGLTRFLISAGATLVGFSTLVVTIIEILKALKY